MTEKALLIAGLSRVKANTIQAMIGKIEIKNCPQAMFNNLFMPLIYHSYKFKVNNFVKRYLNKTLSLCQKFRQRLL